jgi:hypothetical protein
MIERRRRQVSGVEIVMVKHVVTCSQPSRGRRQGASGVFVSITRLTVARSHVSRHCACRLAFGAREDAPLARSTSSVAITIVRSVFFRSFVPVFEISDKK